MVTRTPKTVLSTSWGVFYDHFRMGVTRDIPAFGGAAVSVFQDISFPRLFYGDPSIAPLLGGLCLSPDLTDAQIAAYWSQLRRPTRPAGSSG